MPDSPTRKSGNSAGWRPCATASDASRASAFDGPVTKVSKVQGSTSWATGPTGTAATGAHAGIVAAGWSAGLAANGPDAMGPAAPFAGATSIDTPNALPPTSFARQPIREAKWLRTRSRWNAFGARSTRRSGSSRTLSGRIQASRLTEDVSLPSRRRTPSQTVGGEVIQLCGNG